MIQKHTLETAIIFVVAFWIFVSCGTRKTETEKSTVDDERINIENTYLQQTKTILGSSFTYTPVDGLKPMIIEGRKFENAVVSGGTTSEYHHNNTKHTKYNINTTYTLKERGKTDRTDNTILWLGFFLIFVVAIFAWFYFKRYR